MRTGQTESPIDDLTFDVITVLQNKAKALEAYDKYIRDAADDEEVRDLFVEMRQKDEEHIRVLKEVLARRLDEDLGYAEDEDEDEYDEDEDADDSDDSPALDASSDDDGPPPRRGESTHRRGA